MRVFLSLLLFYFPPVLFSQTVRSPVSAPYIGLGALSNNQIDAFSFHSNQAALARIKNTAVGIYGEKRFLLNELGLYDATAVLPTSSGNFGLNASYYGFSDYNESQFGLAYARSLGSKADIGVQFNYYDVRVSKYGNASAVNFEIGAILHLTENLNAGLHVYNPLAGKLGKDENEKLASVYSAGIGYEPSDKFFISVELQKVEDKPVNVKAGLQYKFLPELLARGGVSAATSTIYFGIGFKWKSVRLDATASYHPQLGITPGILLLYNFNKKED